jgi:L-asparaginase / beta-aspartyl-peptidase
MNQPFAIAVHGGAGTILRQLMTPEMENQYKQGLSGALNVAYKILVEGGTSLDAVEGAVKELEDFPLFNAGRGSVFNNNGTHEMDAAIMSGKDLRAGAVAGVSKVKNPVKLARAVMEKTEHVFLVGKGAEIFCDKLGLETMDAEYFYNELRYKQWEEAVATDTICMDHNDKKFGTVGAVALDKYGDLAAATSTGGMTNKKFGRVGDSPIIGSGTYANNHTCAISCTGHGEPFIRAVVGHDISCLMEYKGLSLQAACDVLIHDKLIALNGEGGLIAINGVGNVYMPFNSEGMYRGFRHSNGTGEVSIYKS